MLPVCDLEAPCLAPRGPTSTSSFPALPAEWMAPEVIRSEPYDERADVYSYGVVSCSKTLIRKAA